MQDDCNLRYPPSVGRLNIRPLLKSCGQTGTIAAVVSGLLLLTTHVFHLPKALCITLGFTLLVVTALEWALFFNTPQRFLMRLIRLLVAWITVVSILFSAVYHLDQGGWLWFRLTGYDIALEQNLTHLNSISVSDFLAREPWFSVDPRDSHLVLPEGQYDVRHTIVVPSGTALTIEPGTVLRFRAGRSLISYSPIVARGTPSKPIVFTAHRTAFKWGVVGVVAAGKSVFEHVDFDNGRWAIVNDITFPGGLSVIDSDVEIRHSHFCNMFGKDAVYVQHGNVLIQHNSFHDVYKDGVDLDSGQGEISDNSFVNCHDEGIDLSDSREVKVFDNTVLDAKGGCIGSDDGLDELRSLNFLGYVEKAQQRSPLH